MPAVIKPLMLQTWSREITKSFIASSVWGQFSNINDNTKKVPKDTESKVPKTAIHFVSSEFKENAFKCTIPLLKSLVKPGVGGRQTAKGTGEKPETRYSDIFWNRVRKVINSDREGVDIKSVEYLKLAKKHYDLLGDWFKQDEDYSFQRAICEGADIYLTDNQFWEEYEVTNTAPVKALIHPNAVFPGMTRSSMPELSLANATYKSNLVNSLSGLSSSDAFGYEALCHLMEYARSHIKPIQSGDTQYIVLLSHVQAAQLRKDPEFIAINMGADNRGESNRVLSGVIGTWQGFKFIEDLRSPIFHLDGAWDEKAPGFEYVTYKTGTKIDRFSGIASLERKAKGAVASATGTCEVARILGNGAIGVPLVNGHNLTFKDEPTDFGDFGEICGRKNTGHCRLDFKSGNGKILENESSALYFTSTPSGF